jgi:outer membrane immunogenic protein
MKKWLATALIALAATSGTAFGQNVITTSSGFNWSGFYAGLNAGGVWNDTCSNWTPYVNNAAVNNFLANCPNNSAFVYGLQAGYNFLVTPQFMLGGEADFGGWSTKTRTRTATYTGASPPPDGTYAFFGKPSPNGAGTVRMRFGYVADQWMPYATAGFAYASGTPSTTITYTPPLPVNGPPTATSNAVKTLSTNGWTAGAGVEYGAANNFSVKLEWLYYQFGHGQRSVGSCTGTGCDLFYGVGSVVNFQSHNSAELNAVRLGANYLFNWP